MVRFVWPDIAHNPGWHNRMAEHSSSGPLPALAVFSLASAEQEPAQTVHMTRYMF
ncbi:hypothetical protein PY793_08345 [Acetobacter fabarum]|uniref:hypothetical protein n=1 Tax=Acetobacter fabarum TaxID=483199 RepID=UPI00312BA9C4